MSERKEKKKLTVMLICAGAGILLLLFGGSFFTSTAEPAASASPLEDLQTYQASLEEEIRLLCESVSGVSDVTVAVSLSGGLKTVYVTQDGKLLSCGSGSNLQVPVECYETPDILGIGIVCRGGGKDTVRAELLSLLTAAYHLPSNRIYVTEGK